MPRTSTYALSNVTFPYVRDIAGKGLKKALEESLPLKKGLNIYHGHVVHRGVAEGLGLPCKELSSVL